MGPEEFNRRLLAKEKRGRRHEMNIKERHGSLRVNGKSSESSNQNNKMVESSSIGRTGS